METTKLIEATLVETTIDEAPVVETPALITTPALIETTTASGSASTVLDRPVGPIQEPGEAVTAKPISAKTAARPPVASASSPAAASARGGAATPAAPKCWEASGPSLFEAAERIAGDTLERISADLGDCTRCKLHRQRNKIVFGVGNPQRRTGFVGEGPGHDEDMQGIPFVGRAGKLLTQMIEAMGLPATTSTSPTW